MITKQDLESYRYHEQEMEQLLSKLKQYRSRMKRLETYYGGLTASTAAYVNIQQLADKQIQQLLDTILVVSERNSEIVNLINSIPDPKIKAVMYQYYVLGDTWEETAAILDMSVRNAHRLHGYGLEIIKRLQS